MSGILLLIAPVPVHCFSITLIIGKMLLVSLHLYFDSESFVIFAGNEGT